MSEHVHPNHKTLVLLNDGSLSAATPEVVTMNSYVVSGNIFTISGSSNALINGDYTVNGTYNGQPAYEGTNGWLFYAGYWCWHTEKTTYYFNSSYISTTKLGLYTQIGGTDKFTVTSGGESEETVNCETAYISELLTGCLEIGDDFLRYTDYLNIISPLETIQFTSINATVLDVSSDAIAINCALETNATINSEDLTTETTTPYASANSWIPNGPVHVQGNTYTPNTYTNNIIGVTEANTVEIEGWSVTSPSTASRYITGNTVDTPKTHELWFDTDDNNLKIYTQDSRTSGTVYSNTWLRLGYNFPTFQPMDEDDYVNGYKQALTTIIGDLKDYPLANPTITSVTLDAGASDVIHSGAGFTVNNRIVFTGLEGSNAASGCCAYINLSTNEYTQMPAKQSWNTSNGVVGYDSYTYFLTTNDGGCLYFTNPTAFAGVTSVNATGTQNDVWQAITCGPQGGNAIYGIVYNSSSNNTYIVKQTTYPTASAAGSTLNTSTGELWNSMSLTYTGNIYGLPATANGFVLKINTTNDSVTTINIGECPAVRQTILAPNGMLYGFPDSNTSNIIRFDPYSETATLLAASGGAQSETRKQGFCGADGKLYIFSINTSANTETLVFDPVTETTTIIIFPPSTSEDYLTILPGPPGMFYRLDSKGKYMHIYKFYSTLDTYDDYWKYTHFNSR